MTYKSFLTIHAVVAMGNAAIMLIIPIQYITFFGIDSTGSSTAFLVRFLAAALMSYGFACWFTRNTPPSAAKQGMILGLFLSALVSLFVLLVAQLTGVLNTYGWALVLLYLLLCLDLAYYSFIKPEYIASEA